MNTIDTDYLVIGCGTSGPAFADTLIDDSGAHVTIVDRRGKPGGHWSDAHSFVTMHRPSAFYGVNSMELGSRRKDSVGLNRGLYELASGAEIDGCFDRVMNHKLLPSGRVACHPMRNHLGDGRIENLLIRRGHAGVRRRLVDANYMGLSTPSTHTLRFEVAEGMRLGRVQRLTADAMELDQGRVAKAPGTLFVDCTASAVEPRPVQPIFQDGRIVLQMLRLPQPAFSAALTAYVEAHYGSDKDKNRLCGTVPFAHTPDDYPRAMAASMWNPYQWGQDKVLRQRIRDSRLDGFGKLMTGIDPADTDRLAILARHRQQAVAAMANVSRLIAA